MDRPTELVSFILHSENRLDALQALASEPATRPELQSKTDIPRATLSRILADFTRRDLASRDGHRYLATPLGVHLARELRSLFDSVDSMARLQTLGQWLRLPDSGIELGDLAGATVTLPTPADPLAPVKRTAAVLTASEHAQGLCNNAVVENIEAIWRGVIEERKGFEAVVTVDALDVVSGDAAVSELVCDMLTSGRVEVSVYDGEIPQLIAVADGTVVFEVTDDEGAIQGLIETEDESIEAWFDSTFEIYRKRATPVVPEVLTP